MFLPSLLNESLSFFEHVHRNWLDTILLNTLSEERIKALIHSK